MRRIGAARAGLAAFAMGAILLAPLARPDDAGPQARAVRLAYVEGQVQISQGGQVLADPAVANTPLFEGTLVTTADNGRAEIQFEDGSLARLSPDSSLTLSVLRQEAAGGETEIVLESGLGYFEFQGGGASQPRVRFANSVATASGFAVLRISLDNPPGEIAVFSGSVHMERGNALALDLHGGESVALKANDLAAYDLAESIEPDSWDTWNADRDQQLKAEYGARTGATKSFADSNNPAWADLDANGNWYNVPDQGYVWSPYDAAEADWDPYGNGNWMWTPGYGYIWVSGDPWGYIPFQCGSWNYYNSFGWGWTPEMGRCQPWWGGTGWRSNIGFAPPRYRFPVRPRRPVGHPLNGTGRQAPLPLVSVNRRPPGGSAFLSGRGRNTPVVIAGHTVQPLRALSPRPQYSQPRPAYSTFPQSTPQGTRATATPVHPNGFVSGGSHPASAPAPRPSGGYNSHPSTASHAPSGGGGSASHSSGSSGGGSSHGGGGSHR